MSRISISIAAVAVILVCGALPERAVAATHTVAYLNEPALVFTSSQIKANELPNSIFISGMPLTFASDIRLACRTASANINEILVFQPRTKRCMSLTSMFSIALDTHPKQAHFASLEKDRLSLLRQLQDDSYVVMQPVSTFQRPSIMVASTAAESCTCPPDPPVTEDIFINSFESILL